VEAVGVGDEIVARAEEVGGGDAGGDQEALIERGRALGGAVLADVLDRVASQRELARHQERAMACVECPIVKMREDMTASSRHGPIPATARAR
jgi:hypothetical protein